MDREVGALVEAFRGELEGCHQFLDQTGCPRSINGKALTLKDRIMVLVAADHEYVGQVGDAIREVRSIKGLMGWRSSARPARPTRCRGPSAWNCSIG